MSTKIAILEEATQFINECYLELEREDEVQNRLIEIESEVEETGTYEQTFDEVVQGARMAWRNSNRCIGRLFWKSLHVLDAREATTEEEVYEALLHHIKFATNGGKILPTITLFKQHRNANDHVKIHNHQLIRYAGYETEYGDVGDPHSIKFTKTCEKLGWRGSKTNYDILPLVYSVDGKEPVCKTIPEELVMEVPIKHSEYDFESLQAKWYAVPIISEMRLEIGGISYTAAPFNGWYMGTEIGARNFADTDRYNLLPAIAEIMHLDTSKQDTLWQDKSLTELNVAVLQSYKNQGVTIVDHHTAGQQFQLFEKQEAACGRLVTGNWVWLIPPLSPASTHIFHKPYDNKINKPNYFHQK